MKSANPNVTVIISGGAGIKVKSPQPNVTIVRKK